MVDAGCCIECRKEFKRKRFTQHFCSEKCENKFNSIKPQYVDRRKYYQDNKLTFQNRYLENYNKIILSAAKQRAKKKQLPFNITVEDIIVPTYCPLLGIEIKNSIPGEGRKNNSPTLDRIIPELGYIKGNVWVISWKANRIKSNVPRTQLEQFCKNLLKKFKEIDASILTAH